MFVDCYCESDRASSNFDMCRVFTHARVFRSRSHTHCPSPGVSSTRYTSLTPLTLPSLISCSPSKTPTSPSFPTRTGCGFSNPSLTNVSVSPQNIFACSKSSVLAGTCAANLSNASPKTVYPDVCFFSTSLRECWADFRRYVMVPPLEEMASSQILGESPSEIQSSARASESCVYSRILSPQEKPL